VLLRILVSSSASACTRILFFEVLDPCAQSDRSLQLVSGSITRGHCLWPQLLQVLSFYDVPLVIEQCFGLAIKEKGRNEPGIHTGRPRSSSRSSSRRESKCLARRRSVILFLLHNSKLLHVLCCCLSTKTLFLSTLLSFAGARRLDLPSWPRVCNCSDNVFLHIACWEKIQ
jgi:hypothetical protein